MAIKLNQIGHCALRVSDIQKSKHFYIKIHGESFNLYSLALEKGPSGAMFFGENGEESLQNIAKMISRALGFRGETKSWNIDEAVKELGDWARFAIGSNSRIKAVNARNLLAWKPKGETLEKWIEKSV